MKGEVVAGRVRVHVEMFAGVDAANRRGRARPRVSHAKGIGQTLSGWRCADAIGANRWNTVDDFGRCRGRRGWAGDDEGVKVQSKLANVGGARADLRDAGADFATGRLKVGAIFARRRSASNRN